MIKKIKNKRIEKVKKFKKVKLYGEKPNTVIAPSKRGAIKMTKVFEIGKKYRFLDEIFLRVLKKHPEKMPNIFSKIFNSSYRTAIKFLSNKSNTFEDISIISKMPKWIFIKSIFN